MLNSPGFGGQIDPPQLSLLLPQTVLQSVNADAIMLESTLSKSVVLLALRKWRPDAVLARGWDPEMDEVSLDPKLGGLSLSSILCHTRLVG